MEEVKIIEDIKKANITAFKEKDTTARSVYSVLLSKIKSEEINLRAKQKDITEADVFGILQKFAKELADEKEGYVKVNNTERVENLDAQAQIVAKWLPKMLTEEEIYNIIDKMENKTMGMVMKTFSSEYKGKCDMRLVQEVIKKFQ